MFQTIISLLIALGLIVSQADFESRSQQDQNTMVEIVIHDIQQ